MNNSFKPRSKDRFTTSSTGFTGVSQHNYSQTSLNPFKLPRNQQSTQNLPVKPLQQIQGSMVPKKTTKQWHNPFGKATQVAPKGVPSKEPSNPKPPAQNLNPTKLNLKLTIREFNTKFTIDQEGLKMTRRAEFEYFDEIMHYFDSRQKILYRPQQVQPKQKPKSRSKSPMRGFQSQPPPKPKNFNQVCRKTVLAQAFAIGAQMNLLRKTIYLAVYIVDQYTAKQEIKKKQDINSISVACILIAIKSCEVQNWFLQDMPVKCDYDDVVEMQAQIVTALNFNLNVFDFFEYMELFIMIYGIEEEFIDYAYYIADFILFNKKLSFCTSPKLVALGIIAIVGVMAEKSLEDNRDLHSHSLSEINKIGEQIFDRFMANRIFENFIGEYITDVKESQMFRLLNLI